MANQSLTLEKITDEVRRAPWCTIGIEQYQYALEAMTNYIGSDEINEAGYRQHTARFDGKATIISIETVDRSGNGCYLIQRVTLPNGRFHHAMGDIASYRRVKLGIS